MASRKKSTAKAEKPKAKRVRKSNDVAPKAKAKRKAIPLPQAPAGEKEPKQPTLHSRTVEMVLSQQYTDQAMKEILAQEFPDKNLKGYVSFVRSGINHGVIAKRQVIEQQISLPIEKIGVEE
jgi:hypothetical protein